MTGPPAASWPAGPRSWIWSRQRRSSVRDWHQSSTVPTSVTRAARLHRHALGLRLAAHAHQALERRQLADRVGIGAHQVARPVVGPDRAARQREDDRLTHQEVEVMTGDRDLFALLGVARDDAEPGLVGGGRLEPDVERPGRAAADPDAAAAPDDAVIGRPLGHGQVERGVGQDPRRERRARVVGEPRARSPRRSGRGRSRA